MFCGRAGDSGGGRPAGAQTHVVNQSTVETLRTNGTVYSTRTVENVPLQRNAITLLSGPLYTNASGANFTVSTSWIGDTNRVNF